VQLDLNNVSDKKKLKGPEARENHGSFQTSINYKTIIKIAKES